MGVRYNLGDVDSVIDKFVTKPNIAQAVAKNLINPVIGTIAGMEIDRMRAAQMAQQTNMPTIAQQVLAPPAPPMGGMGAPPMGAPPMGGMPPAPPMGAPPMGGMPPGAPPMGAPQMGMADGGLAGLPIPDGMFDESDDDQYAGGGIVAFAQGDEVDYDRILQERMDYFNDPERLKADYFMGNQPKREASERLRQFYANALSGEGQKKRRDEDKYLALAQLGATMASTPGTVFESFSAGARNAIPGMQESAKERRAEEREAIKQLALDEGATNAEAREIGKAVMDGRLKATDIAQTIAQQRSREQLTREEMKSREGIAAADRGVSRANAITAASARQGNLSDLETMVYIMEKGTPAQKAALRAALIERRTYAPSSVMSPTEAAIADLLKNKGGGGSGPPKVNLGGWND